MFERRWVLLCSECADTFGGHLRKADLIREAKAEGWSITKAGGTCPRCLSRAADEAVAA